MENVDFLYIIETIIIRSFFLVSILLIEKLPKQEKFLSKLSIIFKLGSFSINFNLFLF